MLNKDVNYEILHKLNDYDLGQMCQTDRFYNELCKNDVFWMNRTIRRFSHIFSLDDLKKLKNRYADSWRNYYIRLANMLEFLHQRNYAGLMPYADKYDYVNLGKYLTNHTDEYIECFRQNRERCSLQWLDDDFVDINPIVNVFLDSPHYKGEEKKEVLQQVFRKRHYIPDMPNVQRIIYDFPDGVELLLSLSNNSHVRRIALETLLISLQRPKFEKIFVYSTADDILYSLFTVYLKGMHIFPEFIFSYLQEAVNKGATKGDIQKYVREIRFEPKEVKEFLENL